MATMSLLTIKSLISIVFLIHPLTIFASDDSGIYIIQVESPDEKASWDSEYLYNFHHSFLPPSNSSSTPSSSSSSSRIIYSYHNVLSGFAARLSPEEVKALEEKDGFVSVRRRRVFTAQTTHTPNFLGLHQNFGVWRDSSLGRGVIIGMIDSGIMPGHPSFGDDGMAPPPEKWKGKCEFNYTAACNNKLIGARYFHEFGNGTPLDEAGHGTHTASIAAGNFVKGANVYGNANGTAAGIAPLAHVAAYKVCNSTLACSEIDILAAIDAAIEDGVDILSISISGPSLVFWEDHRALGAYTAMEREILTSAAAGNTGPGYRTTTNEAPWILTVGASTIDRRIRANVLLGNGVELEGQSAFQARDFSLEMLPLVFPGMDSVNPGAQFCAPGSINRTDVVGKVVLCQTGQVPRIAMGTTVKEAGGAAMILVNTKQSGFTIPADVHVLPASHVSYDDGEKIKRYINSTETASAIITFKGTEIGDDRSPAVASFSARGPSNASPGILKPDVLGPGVNILAGWPFSVQNDSDTKLTFAIESGTSMSCPHLSGVAALLKSSHPEWSPAAIKSAIMTTTDIVNLGGTKIEDQNRVPADVFATGAGHVNPSRANDPGLVYDTRPEDYVSYLCGLNYTNREVGMILQRRVNCTFSTPETELNYPSFSVVLGTEPQMYTRTVTNVGEGNSSYVSEIVEPGGVGVKIDPTVLNFSELNQKVSYRVTFSRIENRINANFSQGYLKWTSDKHFVRSPIAIIFQK